MLLLNGVHLLPAYLTRIVFGGVGRVADRRSYRRRPPFVRDLGISGGVPSRTAVDSYVTVQGGPRIETLKRRYM